MRLSLIRKAVVGISLLVDECISMLCYVDLFQLADYRGKILGGIDGAAFLLPK